MYVLLFLGIDDVPRRRPQPQRAAHLAPRQTSPPRTPCATCCGARRQRRTDLPGLQVPVANDADYPAPPATSPDGADVLVLHRPHRRPRRRHRCGRPAPTSASTSSASISGRRTFERRPSPARSGAVRRVARHRPTRRCATAELTGSRWAARRRRPRRPGPGCRAVPPTGRWSTSTAIDYESGTAGCAAGSATSTRRLVAARHHPATPAGATPTDALLHRV